MSKLRQTYERDYFSKHIPAHRGKTMLRKVPQGTSFYLGPSESGKSSLMMEQIKITYWACDKEGNPITINGKKHPYFNDVVICSVNSSTRLRWEHFFKKQFNREITSIGVDELDPVYQMVKTRHTERLAETSKNGNKGTAPKTLIILDDIIGKEEEDSLYVQNNAAVKELATSGRNIGVTCLYASQSVIYIPMLAFTNAKFKAIFQFDQVKDRKALFDKIFNSRALVPHIKEAPDRVRFEYFNREMDSLELHECLIVVKYIKNEGKPNAELVHDIYKYKI